MNRRHFIKTTGAALALLVSGLFFDGVRDAGTMLPVSEDEAFGVVERSIKASFGSGFRLLSYKNQGQNTFAEIEHLENHSMIASTDLVEWVMISSDIS